MKTQQVPLELLERAWRGEVSASAVMLLLYLRHQKRRVRYSLEELADEFQWSTNRVRRAFQLLEQMGALKLHGSPSNFRVRTIPFSHFLQSDSVVFSDTLASSPLKGRGEKGEVSGNIRHPEKFLWSSESNQVDLATQLTEKFRVAVKTAGYLHRLRYSAKNRRGEVRRLCQEFGSDRVVALIEWYCERLPRAKELGLPYKIASPKGLAPWFTTLEAKMAEEPTGGDERTQALTERLWARLDWGPIELESLRRIVTAGWRYLERLLARIDGAEQPHLRALSRSSLREQLYPAVLLPEYLVECYQELREWPDWSGSPKSLRVDLNVARFERYVVRLCEPILGGEQAAKAVHLLKEQM